MESLPPTCFGTPKIGKANEERHSHGQRGDITATHRRDLGISRFTNKAKSAIAGLVKALGVRRKSYRTSVIDRPLVQPEKEPIF